MIGCNGAVFRDNSCGNRADAASMIRHYEVPFDKRRRKT
jgi:hypothetical protein